ncbi:hypothetical protein AAFM79_01060 [Trichormus azollae HNT15244]
MKDIFPGGTFLLNAPYDKYEASEGLPVAMPEEIINKNLKFYVINGYKVSREARMGGHINTVM